MNRENMRKRQQNVKREAAKLLKKHEGSRTKAANHARRQMAHFEARGRDNLYDFWFGVLNEVKKASRSARSRMNPHKPRELGGIWLAPAGARDGPSQGELAERDRERARKRYMAGRAGRRQMRESPLKVYEVEAINRRENKKCELEVEASSPKSAIELALAELGAGWEIKEVELMD